MIKSLNDMEVYRASFDLAMDIYLITQSFPKTERYSLTDQIIRSSRSIAANIGEGWGRRAYTSEFRKFLIYASGSLEETKIWLEFAARCNYVDPKSIQNLMDKTLVIGRQLHNLRLNWK